jgi:hypothetical protein
MPTVWMLDNCRPMTSEINIIDFSHLRPTSLPVAQQLGGTLALCVKTWWNFSLMGYLTLILWGLAIP